MHDLHRASLRHVLGVDEKHAFRRFIEDILCRARLDEQARMPVRTAEPKKAELVQLCQEEFETGTRRDTRQGRDSGLAECDLPFKVDLHPRPRRRPGGKAPLDHATPAKAFDDVVWHAARWSDIE